MTDPANPYEPPLAPPTVPVVDTSREALASLIRRFLASEITAFQFDDQLEPFVSATDPVTNYVVSSVWCFYDDSQDHLVCLDKPQWDFFQRLLLVLESDCHIEVESKREWSTRSLVAAAALCVFVLCASKLGWGQHLMLLSIPFGMVSIMLSKWGPKAQSVHEPFTPIIYPFATFSDLAQAYRQADFHKQRFPKELASRRIRSPFMEMVVQMQCYAAWLLLSPIPLACQMLPFTISETRVKAN